MVEPLLIKLYDPSEEGIVMIVLSRLWGRGIGPEFNRANVVTLYYHRAERVEARL